MIISLISFFAYGEYKDRKINEISINYNLAVTQYSETNKSNTINELINIINLKDPTYSPLSLYFIIDNSLINDEKKINELFDVIINKTSLDKEIKNLIIYKKGLFNSDIVEENQLIEILNPLINSDSIWKSHSLYLLAEYFYSKNEKEKSKEFYNQIIILKNANQGLKIEAQKRLNRDLSE